MRYVDVVRKAYGGYHDRTQYVEYINLKPKFDTFEIMLTVFAGMFIGFANCCCGLVYDVTNATPDSAATRGPKHIATMLESAPANDAGQK